MLPATCLPTHCFCEQVLPQFIAQPANTWSAFAFILIGVYIIVLSRGDLRKKTNPLTTNWAYGLYYGFLLCFIGVGTFYYHSQFTYLGQFLDGIGIYLIATAILFYQHIRKGRRSKFGLLIGYILTNLFLGYMLWRVHIVGRYVFAIMFGSVLRSEYHKVRYKTYINKKLLHEAGEILVVAFIIWALDSTKTLCNPESLIQGHALWHILTATSALLIYLYYRSEKKIKK